MRLPYAYDDQLIDAVAVRRKRLLAGFMFGIRRTRIVWLDRLSTFIGSLVLTVVICAVCVAIAFVMSIFRAEALKQQQQQQRYATTSATETRRPASHGTAAPASRTARRRPRPTGHLHADHRARRTRQPATPDGTARA